jgi:hypothetical protein
MTPRRLRRGFFETVAIQIGPDRGRKGSLVMAKSRKGSSKPSVKVRDLKTKKNPKGGAVNTYKKVQLEYSKVIDPNALNYAKFKKV